MELETQTTPQGGRKGLTSTMPTKPEREEAPKHNEHGSRRRIKRRLNQDKYEKVFSKIE